MSRTNSSTTIGRPWIDGLSSGGVGSGTAPALASSAAGIGDPEEHLLGLAVLLDAHAAVAGLLVAVARRLEDARREPRVHIHLAGLHAPADPPRSVKVAREHARGQAVGGVVGDCER